MTSSASSAAASAAPRDTSSGRLQGHLPVATRRTVTTRTTAPTVMVNAHAKAAPLMPYPGIRAKFNPTLTSSDDTLITRLRPLRPIWFSSTAEGAPRTSAAAPTARMSTTVEASPNPEPNSCSTAVGTATSPASIGQVRRELHRMVPV